jgi:hypothetical protein
MVRFGTLIAFTSFIVISGLAQTAETYNPFSRMSFSTSQVTVTAVNSRGEPVADARVEVLTRDTRTAAASAYTNEAGMAQLPSVPDGNYDIVVTKGVNSATERLDVEGFPAQVLLRVAAEGDATIGNRATVSVAQYKIPEKARKAFNKAQQAFDKHNADKAHKYVEEALSIEPHFAEALTLRGILKIEARDETAAIDDLSEAIKADAGYPLAYTALAAAFNRAQRFGEAMQTLERGIAIDPTSWQNYFEMGKAQVSKGDYTAGLKSIDKAQALCNDQYAPLHLVKAHAMLMTKQYENAMSELRAFIEKAPGAPQSEQAREMLQKAQALVAAAH